MSAELVTVLIDAEAPCPRAVAPLLRQTLGMHRIDANRRVRRQRGILVEKVERERGEALVAALSRLDPPLAADLVAPVFVPNRRSPRALLYAAPQEAGLVLGAQRDTGPIPWARLATLWPFVVRHESPSVARAGQAVAGAASALSLALAADERHALQARQAEAGAADTYEDLAGFRDWLEVVDHEAYAALVDSLPAAFVDLGFREPDAHYRIAAPDYMATPLGAERTPNTLRNLWLLVGRLAAHAPHAVTTAAREFLNGTPARAWVFDLLEEMDEAWRVHRYRQDQDELAGAGDRR